MRQISVKKFLAGRPACSIPLGLEFKRWFDAPLSARQNDIITLLEYHRQEKKRAPYLIIHDPHNREDVKEIVEAYLQWRNEMTAPGLRAALITPKRFEKNVGTWRAMSNRSLRENRPQGLSSGGSRKPLSSAPPACGRVLRSFLPSTKVKHFTARSYRAAHGQTFGMVAALNCQQFLPKRKPEDGFADFPSVFITMLDRTSPHHLLILHGCIPQDSNHSFGRFMTRAAAQNAPYLIYDTLSRSFLTPENVRTHFNASTQPRPLRETTNPPRISSVGAIYCAPTVRAQTGFSPSEIPAYALSPAELACERLIQNSTFKIQHWPLAAPPPRTVRECRPRRPKRNCPTRGRELTPST